MEQLYELGLFAGAGGGILGTKYFLNWKTVCYVEWNKDAVEMLKARIRDGVLDDAPIWSDIKSFTRHNNECRRFIRTLRKNRRRLVVSAGFPCQPFSLSGQRQAGNDERNGWADTIRLIREIRPVQVFLENVPGLLSAMDHSATHPVGYFGTILGDLAQSGYDCRWGCLSAAAVGANHKRSRLWLMAYSQDQGATGRERFQGDGQGNGGSGRTGRR